MSKTKRIIIGIIVGFILLLFGIIWNNVILECFGKKSEKGVVGEIKSVIALQDQMADHFEAMGDQYLSEMNYEQAVVAYATVLEIRKGSEEPYIGLAKAYIGEEKYKKALETIESGVDDIGETPKLAELTSEIKGFLNPSAGESDIQTDEIISDNESIDNLPVNNSHESPVALYPYFDERSIEDWQKSFILLRIPWGISNEEALEAINDYRSKEGGLERGAKVMDKKNELPPSLFPEFDTLMASWEIADGVIYAQSIGLHEADILKHTNTDPQLYFEIIKKRLIDIYGEPDKEFESSGVRYEWIENYNGGYGCYMDLSFSPEYGDISIHSFQNRAIPNYGH